MDGSLVSRRGLVLGGLGLGATALLSACQGRPTTVSDQPATVHSEASVAPPVSVTQYVSAARGGLNVKLVIMRPQGVVDQSLPVCLALHGTASDANSFVGLGVPAMLTQLVQGGADPFAVVAVDGGDTFWTGDGTDDPQRMLAEELPGWLSRTQLAATPFGVLGLGSGAYGALNFARVPGLAVAAAVSPEVFRSWAEVQQRKAFADRARWEATEPLLHATELANLPVGVWCGTEDVHEPAARELVKATSAEVGTFTPGGHDDEFARAALPEALKFLAGYVGTT